MPMQCIEVASMLRRSSVNVMCLLGSFSGEASKCFGYISGFEKIMLDISVNCILERQLI